MGGRNRQYNTIDHPSKNIVPQYFIPHRWSSGRFFATSRAHARERNAQIHPTDGMHENQQIYYAL